ncbi:MAG: pyridoxamine 5'-phosphate oxidase family protein [Candidatus Aenigmarchaeota archaeon]|nr:pyridoxamine 5'-phosphate oxidase family protein [Candidatus Aenigmarchaeota archaeon]
MTEINEELKKLIEENVLSFASVDENGNPHCIAVAFVKVVSKNQILVTDNYMAETTKNIQQNPSVALTVWNKNWEENCVGYELRGAAEYFASGKWYEIIKQIPENKNEPCKGAILVTINKIKKLV